MKNANPFRSLVAAAAMLSVLSPGIASAEVELGILHCKSVPGSRVNLVIRSTVDVRCEMKYAGGVTERYKGETGIALGLDLSFKGDEEFGFSVISASEVKPGNHTISGKYIGGKASASLGVGAGAAVLVGGSNDNFGLNPLALEANKGVGVAAGIGFLYIEPDK
ncbi:MAG: DUF992 domain-containing protein [Gammaproteobacteria bacterium]|nr:DUF992 domain-containing protein [Gammaproteobacteria bacterium]